VDGTRLRNWYRPLDLLPGGVETVIGADSSLAATVERVKRDTGLCRPETTGYRNAVRTRLVRATYAPR
jgi:hypothetical protein